MERGAGEASARESATAPDGGRVETGVSDAVTMRRRAQEEHGSPSTQKQTEKGKEGPATVPDSEGQGKAAAADRPRRLWDRVLKYLDITIRKKCSNNDDLFS